MQGHAIRAAAVWLAAAMTLGVCAGQSLPGDSSEAARLVSLSGQVSVLRDAYPWALQPGDAVKAQQVILTGPDGYAVFRLTDGSTFEVFANSRVSFRNNPGNWKDLLDVWIGRVKLYIQKWGGQPNPNRVHTPTAVISVRGTIFDVSVDEDETTLVSVEEGQVVVRHRLIGESNPKVLNAGEYLRVFKNYPLAESRVDKGALLERGLRAVADAFYSILLRGPRLPSIPGAGSPGGIPGGGIPGGGGPTLPGDTPGTPPPPPPPAPPGDIGATPPPPPPGG